MTNGRYLLPTLSVSALYRFQFPMQPTNTYSHKNIIFVSRLGKADRHESTNSTPCTNQDSGIDKIIHAQRSTRHVMLAQRSRPLYRLPASKTNDLTRFGWSKPAKEHSLRGPSCSRGSCVRVRLLCRASNGALERGLICNCPRTSTFCEHLRGANLYRLCTQPLEAMSLWMCVCFIFSSSSSNGCLIYDHYAHSYHAQQKEQLTPHIGTNLSFYIVTY